MNTKNGDDEGEADEEEETEERNEPDEPEPELPHPLLIPISEDVDVGPSPPWVIRLTSQFVPEHSPVAVVCTRWPGAVAVATDRGKFFENLYVGFGQKDLGDEYDPVLPPVSMMEFPSGPEVVEQEDPSPEEEAAIRAAMKEQQELAGTRGGDEDEGEGDEDEDGEEGAEDVQEEED